MSLVQALRRRLIYTPAKNDSKTGIILNVGAEQEWLKNQPLIDEMLNCVDALVQIDAMDYRGNRPQEQQLATDALIRISKLVVGQ
jgi:hypothetical protein